jgi:hypothetical protein
MASEILLEYGTGSSITPNPVFGGWGGQGCAFFLNYVGPFSLWGWMVILQGEAFNYGARTAVELTFPQQPNGTFILKTFEGANPNQTITMKVTAPRWLTPNWLYTEYQSLDAGSPGVVLRCNGVPRSPSGTSSAS